MNLHRVETTNTIWEFDLDRMMYLRIPKSESPIHPIPGAKQYEGHHVAFYDVKLGAIHEHMQHFYVYNTGVRWGSGAVTNSWAIPGQDFDWIEQIERETGRV